jgi:AraC-like DNA-binding protein
MRAHPTPAAMAAHASGRGVVALIIEYAFRVRAPENPVMRFTETHPEHRILITLLRRSTAEAEERAVYTFLGDTHATRRFLAGEFAKRHGSIEPISQDDDHVSVEVSTHLLPRVHGRTPNEMTYEVLGRDAVFLPFIVLDGWLHVRVLSANQAAGRRFLRFLEMIREYMRPEAYTLYPARPYRPELRLEQALALLTARQEEVLTVAHEMGYWDDTRRATLDTIAERFGISKAAVHKSLTTAERRVMRAFIQEVQARKAIETAPNMERPRAAGRTVL